LTSAIGPDYRRVTDMIRSKITAGEWHVGQQIPSTPRLIALTGLSITSVRRGVEQLQADGILEGHPGKGVFVKAMPEDADRERADVEALGEQFAELRQEVRELAKHAGYDEDLRARLGHLEARVGRVEAIIVNLSKRTGGPNPFEGEHDDAKRPTRRGRAG
jgi:DNA-binding GntR family transcriptional regulator